jgi:glutamate 5-kinase
VHSSPKICHARLSKDAGTSSIVDEKTHEPLIDILSLIVKTAVKLHKDGHKVIIVSSGAIGVGLRRMDLEKRPKYLPRIQVNALPSQWQPIVLTRMVRPWQQLVNADS